MCAPSTAPGTHEASAPPRALQGTAISGASALPAAASSLSPGNAPAQASSSLFLVSEADGQLLEEDQGSSLLPPGWRDMLGALQWPCDLG